MARELVDLPLGKFLFTRVSFDSKRNVPYFRLMDAGGVFVYARPAGDFTLTFDLSYKRCTGWYDMRTGECYECPGKRDVSEKYEQCPECQQKTGFNPAFYNTTELSVRQPNSTSCSGSCLLWNSKFGLRNYHTIAITKKSVSLGDSVLVCGAQYIPASKCRSKHEDGAFWQMKVCD